MKHELKTDGWVFDLSWRRKKPFEIRYDDRQFMVGDELLLLETTKTGEEIPNGAELAYTGREISCKVLSKVKSTIENPKYGLAHGWCVLGVEEIGRGEV